MIKVLIFRNAIKWIRKRVANTRTAVQTVLLIVASALALNTAGSIYFDGAKFGDAWWYSIISITTTGYGDLSASSQGARISTTVGIVLIGLPAFGNYLAS